jgi:hypothetical protein
MDKVQKHGNSLTSTYSLPEVCRHVLQAPIFQPVIIIKSFGCEVLTAVTLEIVIFTISCVGHDTSRSSRVVFRVHHLYRASQQTADVKQVSASA